MCWPAYFETRFHAYAGISRYFFFFLLVNVALAVWAFSITDDEAAQAVSRPGPSLVYDCTLMNEFTKLMGGISVVEGVLSGLLSFAFLTLMQGYFLALFCLGLLVLLGLEMLIKTVFVILGVIWLWGDPHAYCSENVAKLYSEADSLLQVELGVITFQYLLGTMTLIALGLHHAVYEAVYHIKDAAEDDYLDTRQVSSFG